MAFNYSAARGTASRLIQQFGASVNFNRISGGTFDPVAGQTTGESTSTESVNAVSLPVSSSRSLFDARTFEDLVSTESRFFYAEAASGGYEPQPGDLIEFDSKIWEVAGVTPLNPTGAMAVYYAVGAKLSGRSTIP